MIPGEPITITAADINPVIREHQLLVTMAIHADGRWSGHVGQLGAEYSTGVSAGDRAGTEEFLCATVESLVSAIETAQ